MNKHIKRASWEENAEYYEAPKADWPVAIITVLLVIGIVMLGADIIFGVEEMTNWYAGFFTE